MCLRKFFLFFIHLFYIFIPYSFVLTSAFYAIFKILFLLATMASVFFFQVFHVCCTQCFIFLFILSFIFFLRTEKQPLNSAENNRTSVKSIQKEAVLSYVKVNSTLKCIVWKLLQFGCTCCKLT